MRNTKVIDIIDELSQSVHSVECYDPWVNEEAVKDQYQINQIKRRMMEDMMLLFLQFLIKNFMN